MQSRTQRDANTLRMRNGEKPSDFANCQLQSNMQCLPTAPLLEGRHPERVPPPCSPRCLPCSRAARSLARPGVATHPVPAAAAGPVPCTAPCLPPAHSGGSRSSSSSHPEGAAAPLHPRDPGVRHGQGGRDQAVRIKPCMGASCTPARTQSTASEGDGDPAKRCWGGCASPLHPGEVWGGDTRGRPARPLPPALGSEASTAGFNRLVAYLRRTIM